MPRALRLLALAAVLAPVVACGGNASPNTAAAQQRFGVRMAERGLWSEAWFRFDQARQLGGGNDPELLNNLAVAAEALGRFDDALGFYRQALALAPGNRELKDNYDRFVGFYESFRAQEEAAAAAPAAPAPTEPPADFGSPAPAAAPSPGPAGAPEGGVVNDPTPVPQPSAPQPAPQPSDSDEPPPSDPDGAVAAARLTGGSQHG